MRRRRVPRVAWRQPATLDDRIPAEVVDLSIDGAMIRSLTPIPAGTDMTISFGRIRVRAGVRWGHGELFGCAFWHDGESHRALERLFLRVRFLRGAWGA